MALQANDDILPTNSLSGKELKVSIGELGNILQVFRNSSGHVTGFGGAYYEIVIWIGLRLNFSTKFELWKDNGFGFPVNGTWTGMRGQILRKEVDLGVAPFTYFTTIREFMDLTIYVNGDAFGMVTQYPIPQAATDGPIKVFSLEVWIGLILSMMACVGCIQLVYFLTRKYLNDNQQKQDFKITFGNTSLYILGTLTNHCVNFRTSGYRPIGIISFIWILTTFVFVNIYSSCMSSFMSLQSQRPNINTFQDLASNPNYLPMAFKGASLETYFINENSGKWGIIADKYKKCNDACRIIGYDRMIEKTLADGNLVTLTSTILTSYYMKKTMSGNQCRLTMAQETFAFLNTFFAVPRNSPYVADLNKASYDWLSFGFYGYMQNRFFPPFKQCMLRYNSQGQVIEPIDRARLQLKQLYLAFVLLLIGYLLALFQFIRERISKCCHR